MKMNMKLIAALMPFGVAGAALGTTPTFTPLGHLPGSDFSQATSISNDGQYVGGHADLSGGFVPIIWDGTAVNQLTVPAGFDAGAYVNDLAGDGQTAVAIGPGPNGFRGIRWDANGNPHILETGPGMFSSFNAINLDGSVVAGFTNQDFFTGSSDAVIWTSENGEEIIGDIPGPNHEGSFTAVSDDGTLFAGYGTDTTRRPIFWNAVEGFRVLSGPDGLPAEGMVIEMSPNGNILVGSITSGMTSVPAFWSNGDDAHVINLWSGYEVGEAVAAVNDGSVVVGTWRFDSFSDELGSLAFIWDAEHGARPLQEVLEDEYGINFGGWSLNQITAISPDGTAMAGTGLNPEGNLEAFKILLPDTPGLIGDLNGDGVVNVADMLILLAEWGACPTGESCNADLNGDGVVDVADLLILLANWG